MIRRTEWVTGYIFPKENNPCSLEYNSLTNLVSIWLLQKLLPQKLRAPFCTAAIFCLVATKQASETSSWIQWGTASEGSPALWWWSWKLHHSLVWPISPDNSLWGTYRRMGQDPKKRVRNLSVGGQREGLRPWHRSWGRRLGIRKGVIKPQETPCSRASTPKTRVCFMLSPTPLTLRGALPHHHFSRRRS